MKSLFRPFAPLSVLAFLCVSASSALAQTIVSPEVHADRKVTFRVRAPKAQEVLLSREGAGRLKMENDGKGVWSITTEPLEPDLYGYLFFVDGQAFIDPANALMKPNLLNTQSMVHVPGPSSLPWEVNPVPHGTVHRHFYKSEVVGDERDFYVYTPPGYDPKGRTRYPVIYLLHGYSDDAGGWTSVGRAHVIMDNLIARKQTVPAIVVMPLGYGTPEIVHPNPAMRRAPLLGGGNFEKFQKALLQEVIPTVESSYLTKADRKSRAIVGLSMGGGEALYTGLNNIDKFAYVGSFSGAPASQGPDFAVDYPKLTKAQADTLTLLWIGIGRDDFLIPRNKALTKWLDGQQIKHTYKETDGAHTWLVWRRYLAEFAPLLFR